MVHIFHRYVTWLVVSTPLKNIRQLGWLFPIYGNVKVMFQTTNQVTLEAKKSHGNTCFALADSWQTKRLVTANGIQPPQLLAGKGWWPLQRSSWARHAGQEHVEICILYIEVIRGTCSLYKAHFSGLCKRISPHNMAKHISRTYLHYRILKFLLMSTSGDVDSSLLDQYAWGFHGKHVYKTLCLCKCPDHHL